MELRRADNSSLGPEAQGAIFVGFFHFAGLAVWQDYNRSQKIYAPKGWHHNKWFAMGPDLVNVCCGSGRF